MTLRRTLLTATTAALTLSLAPLGAAAADAVTPQVTPVAAYATGAHMAPALKAYPWLGTALSGEVALGNGWYRQRFTYGLAFTNGYSSHVVGNALVNTYLANAAALGHPNGNAVTITGGIAQWFVGGRIMQATGATPRAITGVWATAYSRAGGPGTLGFPTSSPAAIGYGSYMQLSKGRIYSSGYGTWGVRNAIDSALRGRGGVTGWLGFPMADATFAPGAVNQRFLNGRIYATPNGRNVALSNTKMNGMVPPTGPAAFAVDQIGDTYRLYATGPDAWDCSSLVGGSFTFSGSYVGVGTSGIRNTLPVISRSSMRPGDVMWWPGHVAIYMGTKNGTPMLVNAMNPTMGIKTVPVSMVDTYSGYGTALKSPLRVG